MAARAATWWAIAVGGSGGALAALVGSGSAPAASPPPSVSLPLRPLGAIAEQAPSATPALETAPSASSSTTPALPTAVASAEVATPGGETATRGGETASEPARAAAPPPAADLLPLPTTKQSLLRQEMRCDQRKAEACIVAARSYESGSAGLSDAQKAAKYRRIALTALISQCDHNAPAACATLATMYRAGSGVPQSDRNAAALFARARELCRFNDAPVCHELPSP